MLEIFSSYGAKRGHSLYNGTKKISSTVVLIVIFFFVSVFFFQGSRKLYEMTESRYDEAAREMVETGNYLLNNRLRSILLRISISDSHAQVRP